jgi:hypothetical protein
MSEGRSRSRVMAPNGAGSKWVRHRLAYSDRVAGLRSLAVKVVARQCDNQAATVRVASRGRGARVEAFAGRVELGARGWRGIGVHRYPFGLAGRRVDVRNAGLPAAVRSPIQGALAVARRLGILTVSHNS